MDNTPDITMKSKSTTKPKLRNNSFLFFGCFGFSTKNGEKNKKHKINSDDQKTDRWRCSWSRLRRKKFELSEKVNRCKQMVHAEDKIARKSQLAVTGEIQSQNLQDKPLKKKKKPDCGKSSERRNSSIIETSQELSCYDTKEEENDKIAPQESLGEDSKPSQNTSTLSKSSSFTLQRRKKKVTIEAEKDKPQEGEKLVAKSESIYGLSILMVALITMLVCGKLCAILCASAWLYSIPRLKRSDGELVVSNNSAENTSKEIELNMVNEAHKKKVVFDGFLERNHRKNFV